MNNGFVFYGNELHADVEIRGSTNRIRFDFKDVIVDTGAEKSCFPEGDLINTGANPMGLREVETASGKDYLPQYGVRVFIGNTISTQPLSPAQTARKQKAEREIVHAIALVDRILIGQDILKRYRNIQVNWHDHTVIDIDLA
jgi:hypothetical protein